jgi:RNA recognition motif-containing protein
MNNKLYVGNLSFKMDEQTLTNLFSSFGNVQSTKIIMDRESGRSKGFAFVEMSTEAEANEAIAKLNGSEQLQRAMTVTVAKPMEPKTNRGGGFGGGGSRGGGGGRY